MLRRRRTTVVVVAVALLGVLGAVLTLAGGTTANRTGTTTSDGMGRPAVAHDSAGPGAETAASGAAPDLAAPEPAVPVAPDAPTDRAGTGSDPAQDSGSQVPGAQVPGALGRDVVRTAQLTLQVADPVAATRGVRTAVAAAGGFVAEEQADTTGSWLVVRVPAAGLDRLVDDLAATGTVLTRSGRIEDATDQVVDLDGRVATQQASVTRVRALLAQATSIGDIVTVESELARREADLDSLERRLAALRDRVALSTLTVELRGPATTEPVGSPPGFGTGLGAGWAGAKVIGTALATAAGFVLPFLPVLAVAAVVLWVVVRRRRRTARGTAPAPQGAAAPAAQTPATPAPAASAPPAPAPAASSTGGGGTSG